MLVLMMVEVVDRRKQGASTSDFTDPVRSLPLTLVLVAENAGRILTDGWTFQ